MFFFSSCRKLQKPSLPSSLFTSYTDICLSTNLVGGLGNQLFLIANLLAAKHRLCAEVQAALQEEGTEQLVMKTKTPFCRIHAWLPREKWSSSAFEPRPTYWHSLFKDLVSITPTLSSSSLESESPKNTPSLPSFNPSVFLQQKQFENQFGETFIPPTDLLFPSSKEGGDCRQRVTIVPDPRPVHGAMHVQYLDSLQSYRNESSTSSLSLWYIYFVGFFQSSIFFDDRRETMIAELRPTDLYLAAKEVLNQCFDQEGRMDGTPHRIALHIRRTDYLQLSETFEILDHSYYDAALQQLLGAQLYRRRSGGIQRQYCDHGGQSSTTISAAPFQLLIFSDDVQYADSLAGFFRVKYKGHLDVRVVSRVLKERDETLYKIKKNDFTKRRKEKVDEDSFPPTYDDPSSTIKIPEDDDDDGEFFPNDVLELLMISQCDDVIMANSSFSWWGAYFNEEPYHRVVAPSKWFKQDPFSKCQHLYCPDWMIL